LKQQQQQQQQQQQKQQQQQDMFHRQRYEKSLSEKKSHYRAPPCTTEIKKTTEDPIQKLSFKLATRISSTDPKVITPLYSLKNSTCIGRLVGWEGEGGDSTVFEHCHLDPISWISQFFKLQKALKKNPKYNQNQWKPRKS